MTHVDWEELASYNEKDLRISALWHPVVECVMGPKILKMAAEGSWACFGGSIAGCGPDGIAALPIQPERLLLPTAPVGALLGKLGGSTAGQGDGAIFCIGSFCIFSVPPDASAPLFIGVNGAWLGHGNLLASLKLTIWQSV